MSDCYSCGAVNPNNAKYCRVCGKLQETKFDSHSKKTNFKETVSNKIRNGLLIFISTTIGFAASYQIFKAHYQKQIDILTTNNKKLEDTLATQSKTENKANDVYILRARFENVGNIKKGSLVKGSGIQIGVVSNLKFIAETYDAEVEMQINEQYKFPNDSFANITTDYAGGNSYISLEAGGGDEILKPGDIITHTQDAISMEKLVSEILYNAATKQPEKK